MGDWEEPRGTNIVGNEDESTDEVRKDFSDCMPPKPKDNSSLKDQVCGPVKHEGKPCLALFRENTGGLHPALSDNAGRLIIRQEPAFLSDEVEVIADQSLQITLIRDVSLYQTYAYFVTNTEGGGTAEVALRSNGIHRLSTASVAPGQTVVLTPSFGLPYPVFDSFVDIEYSASGGTAALRIRFTGQLAGALHGLPCAPFAWGDNGSGQIGDSSREIDRSRPVQILRLAGVRELTGGGIFSMGLLSDGTVWTWGDNSDGQLGDGTFSSRLVPVQVTGVDRIISIAAGNEFALALRSDGGVFSWGDNTFGQLGNNDPPNDSPVPVRVLGVGGSGFLSNIRSISAHNDFGLASDSKGFVYAWGDNSEGQLGNNNAPNNSPVPVRVLGVGGIGLLNNIIAVSAGDAHSLALHSDGAVFSWGDNVDGQLGNNNQPVDSPVPVQVVGIGGFGFLSGIKAIAAGAFHNLALRFDGTVVAWGDNSLGQLGNNNPGIDSDVPVQVLGPGGVGILRNIVAIAAGGLHSLALTSDGHVYAWGNNFDGQLGNGTFTQSNVPVLVGTLSDVIAIGSGRFHSFAIVR